MTDDSPLASAPLLWPWAGFGLLSWEDWMALQQHALQQWFQLVTALVPGVALPADPANVAEAAGAVESAAERALARAQAPVPAPGIARKHAPEREHATADAGSPRRTAAAKRRSPRRK